MKKSLADPRSKNVSLVLQAGGDPIDNFVSYEDFLTSQSDEEPEDQLLGGPMFYTSGTTGNPKGVVYHHRGSYLMSTGSAVAWNMPNRLNFLTVVPMFHCNGWCYPWTIPMLNGKTICLRAKFMF